MHLGAVGAIRFCHQYGASRFRFPFSSERPEVQMGRNTQAERLNKLNQLLTFSSANRLLSSYCLRFPFNAYAAAFVGALIVSAASLPFWRWFCRRAGLIDDPGHRKIHSEPIPLAGGFAVFSGLLIPTLLAGVAVWLSSGGTSFDERSLAPSVSPMHLPGLNSQGAYLLRHGLDVRAGRVAAIFLGAIGMLALGVLDDRFELRAGPKFFGQVLVALLVAASGIRITLFVHNPAFSYAVTVLWILTVINAFNFMDNMNGLCVGLGAIASWYFAMIAAASGQYLVGAIAFLTAGALLGFLPYNFPKASAFLGDGGSHLVGYLLAVLAVLPHFYNRQHQRPWAVLIPLIVLAVPLFDLVYVVFWRWQHGQPFYKGDTNHLSHRLVRRGMSRTQAVLTIWLAAAAMGLLVFLC
jgi:UDP-GlcNAc:undecaprenyl-phosphate GlcNAc-1-phosphate transferase